MSSSGVSHSALLRGQPQSPGGLTRLPSDARRLTGRPASLSHQVSLRSSLVSRQPSLSRRAAGDNIFYLWVQAAEAADRAADFGTTPSPPPRAASPPRTAVAGSPVQAGRGG